MTHASCPSPMPESGTRCLSPREAQQRARAMACQRDPTSTQCQGQVYVNLFFDGTGNNREWHEPDTAGTQIAINSHSNVARLFDARIDQPQGGFFSTYIPGVGTPFPEIGDSGGMFGNAFGKYGAARINWAIVQTYNAMHEYLTGAVFLDDTRAGTIVGNISSLIRAVGFEEAYRRSVLRTWEAKLAGVVKSHQRKLLQVNVAVFGFSRGAAEARAFAHWLLEIARSEQGGYRLAGVPVRLYFMGLFDTVASVGSTAALSVAEGKMGWADGRLMAIHPAVEQCVHFIALHEQRANFPLDATRVGKQVAYPGAHCDVGGGYVPGAQGKAMPDWSPSPHLSQIPLIDMHFEAIKAGVPLLTMQEVRAKPKLAKAFHIDPKLITAYNDWRANHGLPTSGRVTDLAKAHARQAMQWQGWRLSQEGSALKQPYFVRADQAGRGDLIEARTLLSKQIVGFYRAEEFNARMGIARASGQSPPGFGPYMPVAPEYARSAQPTAVQTELFAHLKKGHRSAAPPEVSVKLFDDYVHDSMAGFRMPKRWGFQELRLPYGGYFRYRQVFAV